MSTNTVFSNSPGTFTKSPLGKPENIAEQTENPGRDTMSVLTQQAENTNYWKNKSCKILQW